MLGKWRSNFYCLHWPRHFCCHCACNLKKTIFRRITKLSCHFLDMIFDNISVKQRCEHSSSLRKRKQCQRATSGWRVKSEWRQKGTFDLFKVWTIVHCNKATSNCEIYFPLFFEAAHTTLEIFSQYVLIKCRLQLI